MFGVGADQPGQSDWAKSQLIASGAAKLFSLTVRNKASADDFHLQIFDVSASADATGVPVYDLPVYAGSYLPFAFSGGKKFWNGIYVRAVTTVNGSTLISATDAKFTWDKMDGQ